VKHFLLCLIVSWFGTICTLKAQTDTTKLLPPPEVISPDTVVIRQINGNLIHLIGIGNVFVSYTETIDGYTLVLNKDGLYTYGKNNKQGDILPTKYFAHDPDKRDEAEQKRLLKMKKHIRYSGQKLQHILHRQKDSFSPHKKTRK
jgi:hypothetical protein